MNKALLKLALWGGLVAPFAAANAGFNSVDVTLTIYNDTSSNLLIHTDGSDVDNLGPIDDFPLAAGQPIMAKLKATGLSMSGDSTWFHVWYTWENDVNHPPYVIGLTKVLFQWNDVPTNGICSSDGWPCAYPSGPQPQHVSIKCNNAQCDDVNIDIHVENLPSSSAEKSGVGGAQSGGSVE